MRGALARARARRDDGAAALAAAVESLVPSLAVIRAYVAGFDARAVALEDRRRIVLSVIDRPSN